MPMNLDLGIDNIRHDLMANVFVVDVTPALAEKWLAHNTHNRNKKVRSIAQMSVDMDRDAWTWPSGLVCFAADGTLFDGQNRLYAIIESGKTVPMIIVTQCEPMAQQNMDTGTSRKLADVLTMRGEVNASTLGAVVRLVEAWERGVRGQIFGSGAFGSIAAAIAFLDAHPEVRSISNWAKNTNIIGLSPGILGLAYWATSHIDVDDAEEFFARLADGQHLERGHAIYELRRTLTERSDIKANTTTNRTWLLAITFKAWNAYRDGTPVSVYR